MTAVIAVFVIQIRWGVVLMLAGFVALYIDYLIYLFGDFGFDLIPVNIYDSFAINLFYVGFTFTFIAFTAYSFKKYFYLYTHELRKKNLLNEELIANNQELNKLYQALENYTEALEESSKRLEEYAWMNAHKVRAPLARIQGLLLIIHLQKQTDDRVEIDVKLNEAALELDGIVREMNELLEVLPKPLPPT
jgi:signal transduction histidine kinase